MSPRPGEEFAGGIRIPGPEDNTTLNSSTSPCDKQNFPKYGHSIFSELYNQGLKNLGIPRPLSQEEMEMDEWVEKRLPLLEQMAIRHRFCEPRSDHDLLIEIRDSLQTLEERLSKRPGLIITGNEVINEWNLMTRRKRS